MIFDTNRFNLSRGTSDPLPEVTTSIQGGKRLRAISVAGITYLWVSGATDSMINRKKLSIINERCGIIK